MVQEKIVKKKKLKKRYKIILGIIVLFLYLSSGIRPDSIYLYSQYEPKPTSIEMLRFMVENNSKLMTLFDEDGDDLYYDDDGYINLIVKNKGLLASVSFASISSESPQNKLISFNVKRKDIKSDMTYEIDKNNQIYYASQGYTELEITQEVYDMFESDFQKFYQPVYEKSKTHAEKSPKLTISKWLFDLRYKPRK